jgi:hypothetical protein
MPKPLFYGIDMSDIEETGESSEPVQYVGVYVLRWSKEAHPSMGFVPIEADLFKRIEVLEAALRPFAKAYLDAAYNNEDWYGALDRISKEDLIIASTIVVLLEEDEDGE